LTRVWRSPRSPILLEGIEYARKHPVDMVLTDYKMPSLDGIEVIRRLRRIFGYEDVPIVCITVVNDREVRYRALEAGATDFLIRPIDRLECGARCRNLLSLRRHEILKKTEPGFSSRRSTKPPANCGDAKSRRCFGWRRPPSSATR